MDQLPKITRANLDMTPFMVKHGQPKKPPHRDQFTVRLSFGGLVEDQEKPLKLNQAFGGPFCVPQVGPRGLLWAHGR